MRFITRQGRALLFTAMVVVGAVCVSYGDNPPALVGHWVHYEGASRDLPEDIELFSDGTGVVDKMAVTWKAENKRLRILSPKFGVAADYNVSGYELVLTYDESRSARFIKKENLEEYKRKKEEEEKKKKEEEKKRIEKISSYFIDTRDGQRYRTVKIGGKTWMAQNMNNQTSSRALCYNGGDEYCEEYGRLYTWAAAKVACPTGWRLPSQQDWSNLVSAAGGNVAGKALKSTSGWRSTGTGTDDFGFSALPGGAHGGGQPPSGLGECGYWWTATEYDNVKAYSRILCIGGIYEGDVSSKKSDALSVRCVQNSEEENKEMERRAEEAKKKAEEEKKKVEEERREAERIKKEKEQRIEKISSYFTDPRDGQKYRTVTIDGKTWMAQNLNYQPPRSMLAVKSMHWCYGNEKNNCDKYGRLYGWDLARTVCPEGWKLPEKQDWYALIEKAGGKGKAEDALKSVSWNGEDIYGFSALPGGGYYSSDGVDGFKFKKINGGGVWWVNDKGYYGSSAPIIHMDMGFYGGAGVNSSKESGYSVRCIQK
jgi:uncharacterized protein (TIGR02145 family)